MKTRQTEEEMGRQHQGLDRPGVQQVPEGSGEQGKMEKTGCKIICGAPTTLTVKGLMMMIVNSVAQSRVVLVLNQPELYNNRSMIHAMIECNISQIGRELIRTKSSNHYLTIEQIR